MPKNVTRGVAGQIPISMLTQIYWSGFVGGGVVIDDQSIVGRQCISGSDVERSRISLLSVGTGVVESDALPLLILK